ncbi:MAG: V-type ATP synthase subunit C [Clostridia bacterium]|nr:V-type ATP synthase subunit C [Clostridia bacterium]
MQREINYAYAVGRIRVAENAMLDKNKYERMIDQPSVDDCLRVLYEAGYQEAREYEDILKNESIKTYHYLSQISPEPDVFRMFQYKNDTHNIKVLLKDEFSNKESDHLLLENGSYEVASLKVMIRERYFKDLPQLLKEAILQVIEQYSKTKDPQIIDILLDQAYFRLFQSLSTTTRNAYLINLARIQIDMTNISAFIRIKSKMEDLELLSKVLIDGGTIDKKEYSRYFQEQIDVFKEKIAVTAYAEIMEQSFDNGFNITKLEKACDNFLMKYLRKSKNKAFGIEPLIGYMVGKETEIRNVRIILVGKINHIDNDIIRERLRTSYV